MFDIIPIPINGITVNSIIITSRTVRIYIVTELVCNDRGQFRCVFTLVSETPSSSDRSSVRIKEMYSLPNPQINHNYFLKMNLCVYINTPVRDH